MSAPTAQGETTGNLRPCTDQRLQGAIVEAYRRGDRVVDIAERYSCSPSLIYARLRRAGLGAARQPRSRLRGHAELDRAELRERLLALRDGGATISEAAECVGLSRSTVQRIAGGWRVPSDARWSLHKGYDDLFWDAWSKALLARGLDEGDVLERAGLSRKAVYGWRTGGGMRLWTFLRMCSVAGIDPSEVLCAVGTTC